MGIKEAGKKLATKVAVAATMAIGLVSAAHAELPAAVATTMAQIQSDGQDMFAAVFPVVGVLVGLGIVIKLFKRFSSKV